MYFQNPHSIVDALLNKSGHLYVCGDINMAKGVKKRLSRIFVDIANLPTIEAKKMIQQLKVNEKFKKNPNYNMVGAQQNYMMRCFGVENRLDVIHALS